MAQQFPQEWLQLPSVLPADAYQDDLCMQLMLVYGRGVYMGQDRQTHPLAEDALARVSELQPKRNNKTKKVATPTKQVSTNQGSTKAKTKPSRTSQPTTPRFVPNQEAPPEIKQVPQEPPQQETLIIDILEDGNDR